MDGRECSMCSGEFCSLHGSLDCDCGMVDRHAFDPCGFADADEPDEALTIWGPVPIGAADGEDE